MSTTKHNPEAARSFPYSGMENMTQAVIQFIISQEIQLEEYNETLADKIREKFIVADQMGNENPLGLVQEVVTWENGGKTYGTLEATLRPLFNIQLRQP